VGHGLACMCQWVLEAVLDVLTLRALVVFECLEAGKSSATRNHLMAHARLVLLEVVILVDLLVVVLVPVWRGGQLVLHVKPQPDHTEEAHCGVM
jgi:hypothetical protein